MNNKADHLKEDKAKRPEILSIETKSYDPYRTGSGISKRKQQPELFMSGLRLHGSRS